MSSAYDLPRGLKLSYYAGIAICFLVTCAAFATFFYLLWFSPDFVRPAKIEKSSESFTRAVACFVVAMSGLGIGGSEFVKNFETPAGIFY